MQCRDSSPESLCAAIRCRLGTGGQEAGRAKAAKKAKARLGEGAPSPPSRASRALSVAAGRRLASALLDWFARNARDLPWRRTRDPYAVWISEIMLQQTQVKTVIPYWERWMRELPNIQALAGAKPEKVLKLWEGLGYYTRARNLHQAAQVIVAKHAGEFPRSFEEIFALPGIGRYTAGAIGSIAFNEPVPVLDGNVIRVLTRFFGVGDNPKEKRTNQRLWQRAEALVQAAAGLPARRGPFASTGNCSSLNQCLMELGAVICAPRQPKCQACPLGPACVARKEGRQASLPNLGRRVAATTVRVAAFVVERKGRLLVRQRPAGAVNGQLWEFPNEELEPGAPVRSAARRLGVLLESERPFCVVQHSITRHRITLEVHRGSWRGPARRRPRRVRPGEWRSLDELETLVFTAAHRRILQNLRAASGAKKRGSRSSRGPGDPRS